MTHESFARVGSAVLGLFLLGAILVANGKHEPQQSAAAPDAASYAAARQASAAAAAAEEAEKERKAAEAAAARAAETARCRADQKCFAEKTYGYSLHCSERIERLAKYDYKWTDGWLDFKYDRYRWKDWNKK